MRRRGIVLGIVLVLAACEATPASPSPAASAVVQPEASGTADAVRTLPRYREVPCPDEIEITALGDHACGELTVLEDRSKPGGRTITLLVVWTPTPVSNPRPEVGAGFCCDLGTSALGVNTTGVTRTRTSGYGLEVRGLRYSSPSLACAEIDGLDVAAAEAPSGDPAFRGQFLDAVAACRARLTAAGIDVAAYDVSSTAADLEDLRATLGFDSFATGGQGDQSLYLFAYLRRWASHVGPVLLDSPRFPQDHDPRAGLESTRYAWSQFVMACGLDAACAQVLPDPDATLRLAIKRLDDAPAEVTVTSGRLATEAGRPVRLHVDGEKLLRVVRSVLGGDGPGNLAGLPSLLLGASTGVVDPLVVRILGNDPTLCAGYRPECPADPAKFSWGTYLTVLCRDIVPFEEAAPAGSWPDDPGFGRLFQGDPTRAACDAWQVPPAERDTGLPVTVATTMLIYSGQFDSWSSRPRVEAALPLLPGARYYEVPGQTHNVMGFSNCAVTMRNAWLDNPSQPPPDTSCLDGLRPVFRLGGASGG